VSQRSERSASHYKRLIETISEAYEIITAIDPTARPAVIAKQLETIESGLVMLKQQTPYTLLMMRVVEIGLPLLLSIFSILFIVRYTLTEARSREIKELVEMRNSTR